MLRQVAPTTANKRFLDDWRPQFSGPVSALSSGSDIAEQSFGPDEEAVSVVSDARDSASVASDAQIAAKVVVDEAREEAQRQAQVANDLQLASRLIRITTAITEPEREIIRFKSTRKSGLAFTTMLCRVSK